MYIINSNDTCDWLLSDGRYHGAHVWQPYGCMIKTYNKYEARNCLRYEFNKNIQLNNATNAETSLYVFLGDMKLYKFYKSFLNYITHPQISLEIEDNITDLNATHYKISYKDALLNSKFQFIFTPIIDAKFLTAIQSVNFKNLKLLVISVGYWNSKYYYEDYINNVSLASNQFNDTHGIKVFKHQITKVRYLLQNILNSSLDQNTKLKILWMLQDSIFERKLYLRTQYNRTSKNKKGIITNNIMNLYDDIIIKEINKMMISHFNVVKLWTSTQKVNQKYLHLSPDGVQSSLVPLTIDLQILINYLCNSRNTENHFKNSINKNLPEDTCCTTTKPLFHNTIFICLTITFISAVILFLPFLYSNFNKIFQSNYTHLPMDIEEEMLNLSPSLNKTYSIPKEKPTKRYPLIFVNLIKLAIIFIYIIICDKTSLFMKENKYYTHLRFFLPMTYFFVIGSFFTERSGTMTENDNNKTANGIMSSNGKFDTNSRYFAMSRNKTNELKGWMQSILLISYMTGATPSHLSITNRYDSGNDDLNLTIKYVSITIFLNILNTAFLVLFGYTHFNDIFNLLIRCKAIGIPPKIPGNSKEFLNINKATPSKSPIYCEYFRFFFAVLRRCVSIVFRYNFIACLLCLALNRPYVFYSFVPLVTFWYLIIVLWFLAPPFININFVYSSQYKFDYENVALLSNCDESEIYTNMMDKFLGDGNNCISNHFQDDTQYFEHSNHDNNDYTIILSFWNHLCIIIKFIMLGVGISLLYSSEANFAEAFSRLFSFIPSSSDPGISSQISDERLRIWWNIWINDRYSVCVGMIFAYLIKCTCFIDFLFFKRFFKVSSSLSTDRKFVRDSKATSSLSNFCHIFLLPLVIFLVYLTVMLLSCRGSYTVINNSDRTKISIDTISDQFNINTIRKDLNSYKFSPNLIEEEISSLSIAQYENQRISTNAVVLDNCFEVSSYLSWIPVVCYFLLLIAYHDIYNRNDRSFSSIFSRLGKFSLELYLCQFHLWQSVPLPGLSFQPTRPHAGILTYLPNYPTLNALLSGFLCICAAWEFKQITAYFEKLSLSFFSLSCFLRFKQSNNRENRNDVSYSVSGRSCWLKLFHYNPCGKIMKLKSGKAWCTLFYSLGIAMVICFCVYLY
ncbi:unnamed protein product [Gordionus sp. m RMFG-2023]